MTTTTRFATTIRVAPLLALVWLWSCGGTVVIGGVDDPIPGAPDASDAAPDAGDGGDAGVEIPDAGADTPDAATPSTPLWILHVTDTHFGIGSAPSDMQAFTSKVLPVVHPQLTIHSGDIVDEGGVSSYWTSYFNATNTAVPLFPEYLEVPGNHDVKNGGAASFLTKTRTGRAANNLHGLTVADTPSGKVRIVRANTADSSTNSTNIDGSFGATQLNNLLAAPAADPVRFVVAAAHHPLISFVDADDLSRMKQLIAHFKPSLYFCGHTHSAGIEWSGTTLIVRGNDFGKNGAVTTFMLAGVDSTGPFAKQIGIDPSKSQPVTWPIVVITSPANRTLGGTNPYAKPIAASTAGLAVRVIAFAPAGVTQVEHRVDAGTWSGLSTSGSNVWEAPFAVPSVVGTHTLEARAVSANGTGTASVSFTVN